MVYHRPAKTELPEKVDILGITYHIELVSVIDDNTNKLGEIDYKEQLIRIKGSLSDERKAHVLLHEILHGIDEGLGDLFGADTSQTESLVQALATALHQTLKEHLTFSS